MSSIFPKGYYTLSSPFATLSYGTCDEMLSINGINRVWEYTSTGSFRAISSNKPAFLDIAKNVCLSISLEI
jgi:hypothetical protein